MDNNKNSLEKYLTFVIDKEVYGVEILKVREIVAMMHISKVPLVPHYVKGVINLRGKVITVVDMREKLGMEPIEYNVHTTIIIIDIENLSIGFIVDETKEVLKLSKDELMPPPKFGTSIDTSFLKAMVKITDEQMVMMVDLEKLFNVDELEALEQTNK